MDFEKNCLNCKRGPKDCGGCDFSQREVGVYDHWRAKDHIYTQDEAVDLERELNGWIQRSGRFESKLSTANRARMRWELLARWLLIARAKNIEIPENISQITIEEFDEYMKETTGLKVIV